MSFVLNIYKPKANLVYKLKKKKKSYTLHSIAAFVPLLMDLFEGV